MPIIIDPDILKSTPPKCSHSNLTDWETKRSDNRILITISNVSRLVHATFSIRFCPDCSYSEYNFEGVKD